MDNLYEILIVLCIIVLHCISDVFPANTMPYHVVHKHSQGIFTLQMETSLFPDEEFHAVVFI